MSDNKLPLISDKELERRRKISETNKRLGRRPPITRFWLGKKRPDLWKGKRMNIGMRGSKNPAWRGGRSTLKTGYVRVHKPDHPSCLGKRNPYIFEHRLVVENILGRTLHRREVVHHINGKHDDNRPENLQYFRNNSAHKKWERWLKRANLDPVTIKIDWRNVYGV